MRSNPRPLRVFTVASFLIGVLPAVAWAHGQPAALAFWGGYPTHVATCQRAISYAASSCISRTVAARTECLAAEASGQACDQGAFDAEVQAARAAARSIVQAVCTSQDAQSLLYVDVSEALVDVINVCRDTDASVMSAAFGPAMVGGSVASMDAPSAACV